MRFSAGVLATAPTGGKSSSYLKHSPPPIQCYIKTMTFIQALLQTIWASILALGWIKVIIAVVVIGVLSRVQAFLGLVAAILFVAFLAGWL